MLLLLLVRVGMLSAETLAKKRRYAVVGVVAFAGVVTPPDVFSQLSLAVPMYLLYEASIWIGYLIEKKRAQADTEEAPAETAAPAAAAAATPAEAAASSAAPVAIAASVPETDFNASR